MKADAPAFTAAAPGTASAAWATARPMLSVLTPFHGDDPAPLLAALETEVAAAALPAEIVLLDDAGPAALGDATAARVRAMAAPTLLIRLPVNGGRAKARNRLADAARGRHVLFLDADMLPEAPDFLARYLELIAAEDPAAAFGGFTVEAAPADRASAVHAEQARRGDCLPASARAKVPGKYVFSSNLLVRRDVLEAEPFDEGFAGWGWEDVDWGLRVVARFGAARASAGPKAGGRAGADEGAPGGLRHLDNPARHLGLDPAATLAAKYEQSRANFARLVARHPEAVRRFASYRAARLLKRAPALRLWRPALKRLALWDAGPVKLRVAALKLYRAALYAEGV